MSGSILGIAAMKNKYKYIISITGWGLAIFSVTLLFSSFINTAEHESWPAFAELFFDAWKFTFSYTVYIVLAILGFWIAIENID